MRRIWPMARSLPGSTSAVILTARENRVLKMAPSSRLDMQRGSAMAHEKCTSNHVLNSPTATPISAPSQRRAVTQNHFGRVKSVP